MDNLVIVISLSGSTEGGDLTGAGEGEAVPDDVAAGGGADRGAALPTAGSGAPQLPREAAHDGPDHEVER